MNDQLTSPEVSEASNSLEDRAIKISRFIAWGAIGFLLMICLAVLVDVVLRWTINQPIHGLEDITNLVSTAAVAACFPAAFGLRSHITVRSLAKAFGQRGGAWLEVFGQAATLLFAGLIAWQLMVYAGDTSARTTLIMGLPIMPAWVIVAFFASLAAVVQLIVVVTATASALSVGKSSVGKV